MDASGRGLRQPPHSHNNPSAALLCPAVGCGGVYSAAAAGHQYRRHHSSRRQRCRGHRGTRTPPPLPARAALTVAAAGASPRPRPPPLSFFQHSPSTAAFLCFGSTHSSLSGPLPLPRAPLQAQWPGQATWLVDNHGFYPMLICTVRVWPPAGGAAALCARLHACNIGRSETSD